MLDLRFAPRAGRVQISSNADYADPLNVLRTRFASAASIGARVFEVDLDDLLVNVFELARWPPSDGDVRWQPELLALVEGNAADAAIAGQRLTGSSGDDGAVAPAVPVNGAQWTGSITDFQQRDLARIMQLTHGANFSVPGAGKTRVALAAYQLRREVGEIRQMLVVCPKSAFESWTVEADICFRPPRPDIATYAGGHPPNCDILLVNYERLPDSWPVLLQWLRRHPSMLVLDEAHRMKLGPGGAWGAACLALGPFATRRLILTGTPAPNGARDLENLFGFVWPGQGRAVVFRALTDNDLRAASRELKPLFVRTTKHELHLPPVDRTVRRVELPTLHRELYDALLGQVSAQWRGRTDDIEGLGRVVLYLIMAATSPALLATGATRHEPLAYRMPPFQPPQDTTLGDLLRDLPNYELSPKYQEVLKIVADNVALGRKTLVWSTFIRNLTSLARLLERFSPAVIHGGTEDRLDELHRFRSEKDCMVLLSNPATMGEGVSLHQTCHDAVYVDRDFAAGRFMQSLDRIHRLGLPADQATRITILVSSRTIDELVEQRLAAKLRFMGGILDDPEVQELADLDEEPAAGAGMDAADMQALGEYLGLR